MIRNNIPFVLCNSILDPHGRLIVTEILCKTPVILVNIYAPSYDDEGFICTIKSFIPYTHDHSLVMGGDFNFVL